MKQPVSKYLGLPEFSLRLVLCHSSDGGYEAGGWSPDTLPGCRAKGSGGLHPTEERKAISASSSISSPPRQQAAGGEL